MDILKEMLLVLFSDDTFTKAKEQLRTGVEKTPIDNLNMNFRLFTAKNGNVNLELLAQNDLGMYFKPIGFFEFDNDPRITILKEFETIYKSNKDEFNKDIEVKYLSLKENSFIAATSSDIVSIVMKMFSNLKHSSLLPPGIQRIQSEKVISNGLTIRVSTSMMGAIETNLDDERYELDDPLLVMFQNNNGISLHATDDEYYLMLNKGLLGAFKGK